MSGRDYVKKRKRQVTNLEEIFENTYLTKNSYVEYVKNYLNVTVREVVFSVRKLVKDLNLCFTEEDLYLAKEKKKTQEKDVQHD